MRRIKPRCRRGIVYHSSTMEKTPSTRKRQTGVLSKSSKIEENKKNVTYLFTNNAFKHPQSSYIHDGLQERFSNPYVDTLTSLDPNKVSLKHNVIIPFLEQQKVPVNLLNLRQLATVMNNPYLAAQDDVAKQIELTSSYLYEKNETVRENAKIITLINEFKTLYVGDSFTPKQNKQRIEKLALLLKYFSKHNNNQNWHLDEKGYLLYKNIKTMNRFVTYIDLFLKYPEEIPQGTKLPIFFQELFLDRIMSDYSKFSPTVHYTPDDHKKKFENSTKTKNDDKILKVYIKITNDQSRVLSRINVFFDQMSKSTAPREQLLAKIEHLHLDYLKLQKEASQLKKRYKYLFNRSPNAKTLKAIDKRIDKMSRKILELKKHWSSKNK